MKRFLFLIILLTISILIGCSDNSEKLLDENGQYLNESAEAQILKRDNILFGNKIGENEIQADNRFKQGENVNFYVQVNEEQKTKSVVVILSKANGDKWNEITQSELPVSGTWKEFMNGISGNIFKQLGPGPYQLEIKHEGETLAKGKFVVEE